MGDDHTSREVTIRGIVVPTAWRSGGQVLRVAILTSDEKQYDVADSGLGRQLLQVLREEIEACVRFDQTQASPSRVTVLSYQIVDQDDDDYVLEDLLKEPDRGSW